MKRLLLAVPLLAVLITGCSGQTEPPKDVDAFHATMQANVSCNRGDTGYYYWRYREVDPADETGETTGVTSDTLHPWVNLPHTDIGPICKNGAVGPVTITQPLGGIPGAVIGQTVYQLKSDTHYVYELCGVWNGVTPAFTETCLDHNGGGHNANGADQYSYGSNWWLDPNADPFVSEQYSQITTPMAQLPVSGASCSKCVAGPGKTQITDANGTVYSRPIVKPPVTNPYTGQPLLNQDGTPYNPYSDPGFWWPQNDAPDTTESVVACPQGQACDAWHGVHNPPKDGWACGDPKDEWVNWSAGGIEMWRATMTMFRLCWGYGSKARQYQWDPVYFNGSMSTAGTLVGWKQDGGQPIYSDGPRVLANGKLFWDRDLSFRLCWPPPWKVSPFGCTQTLQRIAVIMKEWAWVSAAGVPKVARVWRTREIPS